MEIKGKVHCLFEQSGTFKNEFRKLGYEAYDYDIQDEFGETDNIIDLFEQIDLAYSGRAHSIFDDMTADDLIVAFFPCIYFTVQKIADFMLSKHGMEKWTLSHKIDYAIKQVTERTRFHILLYKLVAIADERKFRLVIENPYQQAHYLSYNFLKPSIIDKNRMERGDYFKKPTAYWFFNCEPTHGFTHQNDKKQKVVQKCKRSPKAGLCSIEKSMISPDYARNWICDFVLGKEQDIDLHLDFGRTA